MDPKVDEKPVTDPKADPAKPETDPRGVPWENRAKELERKLNAAVAEIETLKNPAKPSSVDDRQKEKERIIMEFVEDPQGFISREHQRLKFQEELPQAESWLKSQPNFSEADTQRLGEIIRENGIMAPSPMLRARAAYKILAAEKIEREFQDKQRQEKVKSTSPDAPQRSANTVDNKPKKAELVEQLRKAQIKGDMNESTRLILALEKVRE